MLLRVLCLSGALSPLLLNAFICSATSAASACLLRCFFYAVWFMDVGTPGGRNGVTAHPSLVHRRFPCSHALAAMNHWEIPLQPPLCADCKLQQHSVLCHCLTGDWEMRVHKYRYHASVCWCLATNAVRSRPHCLYCCDTLS